MFCKTLVIVTLHWTALSWGFLQGQTTGMIGAWQKKEDGLELSEGEISLLGAFMNLFIAVGLLYVAVISEKFGRRWCFIVTSLLLAVNWIILYYARTFTAFALSRFLAGISAGPIFILITIASTEYISYKSRAVLLSLVVMVVPSFGIGLAHVLGVFFHWRTLALMGIILSSVHFVLPYFWVESPHWLASKGRFEECALVFRKLHGTKSDSENELQLIIKMETKKQKTAIETNKNNTLKKLLQAFKKRYFWDLILMSVFIYSYYVAAGKVIFNNLITVILEGMTGSPDVLLYTLVVDGFIFLGTCISCFLIKKMSIRTLLFSSGLTANGILIALSASLYFKNNEVYFQWINVVLLALYSIVINAGPYPIMDILLGELFPLELKLYCYALSAPLLIGTFFLCLLLLPYIVSTTGYHGLFLLNSGIMFVCLFYFHLRLPETKGKTLQEIELYFKTNSFDVDQVLSSNEEIKNLM